MHMTIAKIGSIAVGPGWASSDSVPFKGHWEYPEFGRVAFNDRSVCEHERIFNLSTVVGAYGTNMCNEKNLRPLLHKFLHKLST